MCGTGIKSPDIFGAWACSACHDEIDRRTRLTDAEYAKQCHLEGVIRTQAQLLAEENIGMNQYHLKLPYPPSLNTYWRHARGRHYIAEKGTRYRQHITELIRQQNLDISTTSRIRISITANPLDKRQRDLDNLPKAVFDSLTHAGFWKDDSQIDDMRIRRGERVSGGSLDVMIWEIGDET